MKKQIEETHKMSAESQKLIAYGKVMDDNDKTVADYKITEGGFIVVMVTKVSNQYRLNSTEKIFLLGSS